MLQVPRRNHSFREFTSLIALAGAAGLAAAGVAAAVAFFDFLGMGGKNAVAFGRELVGELAVR